MTVLRDASSADNAARAATVLPDPHSPVTTPIACSETHQAMRATASWWARCWLSAWGAMSRPKGIFVNP